MAPLHPWRIAAKGVSIFLIFEFAFYSLHPNFQWLNVYTTAALKRTRFPASLSAPIDAALDVENLSAMFNSHIVSRPKATNEFRVLVFGDSAVWGANLTPEQTLSGQLNALRMKCENKYVEVYNLSFPEASSTKDLMILDTAMKYQPDMVVWLITWYTLIPRTRTDHPLINLNPDEYHKLAAHFNFLPYNYESPNLISQITRRNQTLFRIVRFQSYSLVYLATDIDQFPGPPDKLPAQLGSDPTFEGMKPPKLFRWRVSLDQVMDFYQLAGNTPIILVNEPTQVLSNVPNSNIYYNVYYPRWIYDQYRKYISEAARQNHWDYLDLWNVFPPKYFTDTPLHLTPHGETELAKMIAPAIVKGCP